MKRLLGLSLLLLTVACQPSPENVRYPTPRFDDLPKIPIQASEMRVERDYIPTGEYPQVEHEFPVRIDDAAEQWLRDRVTMVGIGGTVIFTVEDARVTAKALPVKKGIKGAFTDEPSEQFDAHLLVKARLENNTDVSRHESTAIAEVRLSRSIKENPTLQERDELYYAMMKDIISRFGQTMEQQLRAQMVPNDSADSLR